MTYPHPLVSIIIPCYNGERFLREAIDSCLAQTYRPVEIIVVDDGSTDGSLDILKSYGDAVIWETKSNRGPSYARNRGFDLSSGKYIQYLDADDYLLPEKLERQVKVLEETGVDVVYSDWQVLYHLPDGNELWSDIVGFDMHKDILTPLLSRRWLRTEAPLFRRDIVQHAGGWDENIRAVEEKDFHLSVALAGARFHYEPGCLSVFRRYGRVTLSTSNLALWTTNAYMLYKKIETRLRNAGQLTPAYRYVLADSYYAIGRRHYDTNRAEYRRALMHARAVCPEYKPNQSRLYNSLQNLLGLDTAQCIASYRRKARHLIIGSVRRYQESF
jgi:glycosyltransferase involved in cell wall biosynthesis